MNHDTSAMIMMMNLVAGGTWHEGLARPKTTQVRLQYKQPHEIQT